jgi:hypothetical protein
MRIWRIGAIVVAGGALPGCGALLDLDVTYVGVDGGGVTSPDGQMPDSIGLDGSTSDGSVSDGATLDESDGAPDAPDTTISDADADAGARPDVAPGDATPPDSSPEGGHTVTPAFVQLQDGGVSHTASTFSLSFDNVVQAHDTLVVAVDYGISNTLDLTVTDSLGNLFQEAGPTQVALAGTNCSIWYALDVLGGSDKVTVGTSANTGFIELYIHEYSGISGLDVFKGQSANTGTGTLMESGFGVTTAPNDLIFGFGVTGGANSGPTFKLRSSFNSNVTEDKIAATMGSYEATATTSTQTGYIMLMAAFLSQ